MNRNELKKLIQKKIDSQLNQEESAKLKAIIDTDLDARKWVEDQVGTASLLEELTSIDPPDHLKKRIMNTIDTNLYTSMGKKSSTRSSWRARPVRISPRLAVAFAFGLVLGIVVPLMMNFDRHQIGSLDSSEFIGTIGLHESEHFTEIERLPVREEQVRGEMVFRTFGDIIGCEISLESENECEFNLEYTPKAYSFYGFRPADMTKIELEHNGNSIRTLNRNQVRYVIFLQKLTSRPGRIQIVLRLSGAAVYRKDVEFGP